MSKLKEGNVVLGAFMASKEPHAGIVYYTTVENNEFANMLGYYTNDLEKAKAFGSLRDALRYIATLPSASGMLDVIPMRVKANTGFSVEEIK